MNKLIAYLSARVLSLCRLRIHVSVLACLSTEQDVLRRWDEIRFSTQIAANLQSPLPPLDSAWHSTRDTNSSVSISYCLSLYLSHYSYLSYCISLTASLLLHLHLSLALRLYNSFSVYHHILIPFVRHSETLSLYCSLFVYVSLSFCSLCFSDVTITPYVCLPMYASLSLLFVCTLGYSTAQQRVWRPRPERVPATTQGLNAVRFSRHRPTACGPWLTIAAGQTGNERLLQAPEAASSVIIHKSSVCKDFMVMSLQCPIAEEGKMLVGALDRTVEGNEGGHLLELCMK